MKSMAERHLGLLSRISDIMKKIKILVVEDENIVAEDIKNTLQGLGYTVVGITATGEGAIEKTKEEEPDLILMDIRLKGDMNGIEAAKKITSKADIPVVFLTACSDNGIVEKAKHTKAFGYLVKPFDEKGLDITIKMTLQKRITRILIEICCPIIWN